MTKRTKNGTNTALHWLDKAEPAYAPANNRWRVRVMRKGQPYTWWLKAGKGDSSSTGKVLALVEWTERKKQIIADENGIKMQLGAQPDGKFTVLSDDMFGADGRANDGTAVETFDSEREYRRVLRREMYRDEYVAWPLASQYSLDDYLDWIEFQADRQRHRPVTEDAAPRHPVLPGPTPFSKLLDAFDTFLKMLQEGRISGLEDDDEGIGESRLTVQQLDLRILGGEAPRLPSKPTRGDDDPLRGTLAYDDTE